MTFKKSLQENDNSFWKAGRQITVTSLMPKSLEIEQKLNFLLKAKAMISGERVLKASHENLCQSSKIYDAILPLDALILRKQSEHRSWQ